MDHQRKYRFGRRVMLISAALYALARAAAYMPNPSQDTPDALEYLSVYVPIIVWPIIWAVCALLCIRDLLRPHGRLGISFLAGLQLGWGMVFLVSYINSVVVDGWGGRDWSSASVYLFTGGIIMGFLIKLGSLRTSGETE